ncbi:hypothetical protein I4F81_007773 [Pyropia yezoensis]|uniref:Uncharacterized protein n=1 Tax=Pyropia yezoensis TaxID=2788 RepID=A0ACC3C5M5_PYRYE|nr:hypothetical protein I4F81_007773 [Neopyropia yezoensis]
MPASTLPLAPPPLLQTIAQGAPAKFARIATAVDGAPSSITFKTLGIDRAAAFGPAGMMVDAPSDDDGSMMVDGQPSAPRAAALSPIEATFASAEAALVAACPNLQAAAQHGIRAAVRAAADIAAHWLTQPAPAQGDDDRHPADGRPGTPPTCGNMDADTPVDGATAGTPSDGRQLGQPSGVQPQRVSPRRRAPARRAPKARFKLTFRHGLMIITMRRAGLTWDRIRREMLIAVSDSAIRRTWYRRAVYTSVLQLGNVDLDAVRCRPPAYPLLDSALLRGFLAVRACGRRTVPVTVSLLKARAIELAAEMGIEGFQASTGYICRWFKRNDVCSICLVGTGASVDVAGSAPRIAEIRETLRGVHPRLIYNIDETGLFYRCLSNRSYVSARERRTARGSKAMRAKERVTAVLCVNADASHKLPIAIIGKAMRPLCFRPPHPACPLPYFHHENSWMDGPTMEQWFKTVFVAEVPRITS